LLMSKACIGLMLPAGKYGRVAEVFKAKCKLFQHSQTIIKKAMHTKPYERLMMLTV
jgi:hypothetical protein